MSAAPPSETPENTSQEPVVAVAEAEVEEEETWRVQAESFKTQGNEAFAEKRNDDAIQFYTQAIELDDENHVYYSNRSAAYLAKGDAKSKAFKDAEMCIKLKPDWAKGYSRKGGAELALGRYDASIITYKQGLKLAPNNAALKQGLSAAEAAAEAARKARWAQAAKEREEEEARRQAIVDEKARKKKEEEDLASQEKLELEEADPLGAFFSEVAELEDAGKGEVKPTKPSLAEQDLGTAEEQVKRLTQEHYQWLNCNPFYVLQLPVEAEADDIVQRYRKMSTLVHPDKCRLPDAREAFEEVKTAYALLQNEEKRKTTVANIKVATKAAVKERREKLKKGIPDASLPTLDEMIEKSVKKHFAEMEHRRRNLDARQLKQKQREQAQVDEEDKKVVTGLKREAEWNTGRDSRMDSWLGFAKGDTADKAVGKKAKKKMWASEERTGLNKPKHDFSGVSTAYKKDWK